MSVLVLMARFEAPEGLPTRDLARAKSYAAQGVLEQAMARLDLTPWVPDKDSRGMPLPRDGWYVSKSHCRDLIAVAVARCPLGVDVEPIRLARVAGWHRVINEAESQILGQVDALCFTRLWTAKEAALKIAGQGIGDLSLCRVVSVPNPTSMNLTHRADPRVANQHVTQTHVVSVCSTTDDAVHWNWVTEAPLV